LEVGNSPKIMYNLILQLQQFALQCSTSESN